MSDAAARCNAALAPPPKDWQIAILTPLFSGFIPSGINKKGTGK